MNGKRIIEGLEDALAFTRGDKSRGRARTVFKPPPWFAPDPISEAYAYAFQRTRYIETSWDTWLFSGRSKQVK